jgi:S-adenosylmethionine decarboxylase
MRRLAPEIFRKRLLLEGFFKPAPLNAEVLLHYFTFITCQMVLSTYREQIVHETSGEGKAANQGFDAFVPLIDSGMHYSLDPSAD